MEYPFAVVWVNAGAVVSDAHSDSRHRLCPVPSRFHPQNESSGIFGDSFKCVDDYFTSIDMATALHPQTLMALTYDGQPLPPKYGFPMKLRMPTKLGYKNPKHIQAMFVTNTYSGGYWEDQGYNWFGGS